MTNIQKAMQTMKESKNKFELYKAYENANDVIVKSQYETSKKMFETVETLYDKKSKEFK